MLDWIVPSLAPTVVTIEDNGADTLDTSLEPSTGMHLLDSDNLIAEDELEGGDDALIDDNRAIELASSTILWHLPVSLLFLPFALSILTDFL